MKFEYRSSMQRTMIIYFLMIGFASFLIAGEFILDIHGKELRSALTRNFEKLSNGELLPDQTFQPLQTMTNKAVLMVALFLMVVLILLTMFIKNITEPLQHMIEVSRLIAAGDLSRTVRISAKNELAEMGDTVNDLTSNLQEMLLLSRDMCASVDQFTEEVSALLSPGEENLERTKSLRQRMHLLKSKTKLMNDIILHCKFYGMER